MCRYCAVEWGVHTLYTLCTSGSRFSDQGWQCVEVSYTHRGMPVQELLLYFRTSAAAFSPLNMASRIPGQTLQYSVCGAFTWTQGKQRNPQGIWKLKMNAAARNTKQGAFRITSSLPVAFWSRYTTSAQNTPFWHNQLGSGPAVVQQRLRVEAAAS